MKPRPKEEEEENKDIWDIDSSQNQSIAYHDFWLYFECEIF